MAVQGSCRQQQEQQEPSTRPSQGHALLCTLWRKRYPLYDVHEANSPHRTWPQHAQAGPARRGRLRAAAHVRPWWLIVQSDNQRLLRR
jgi:hypothetical protein